MSQSSQEFRTLPYNRVVSVFDTAQTVDALKSALTAHGCSDDAINVHHGDEGKRFIDPDGTYHGWIARWIRAYQRVGLSGIEAKIFEQASVHLDAGRFIVTVLTDDTPEEWQQIGKLMAQHTSHAIIYCGQWSITILQSE